MSRATLLPAGRPRSARRTGGRATPPCARCGTMGGALNSGGGSPRRVDTTRYGGPGSCCDACYRAAKQEFFRSSAAGDAFAPGGPHPADVCAAAAAVRLEWGYRLPVLTHPFHLGDLSPRAAAAVAVAEFRRAVGKAPAPAVVVEKAPPPPVVSPPRSCPECGPKPAGSFGPNRARPDGLQVYCRGCHRRRWQQSRRVAVERKGATCLS